MQMVVSEVTFEVGGQRGRIFDVLQVTKTYVPEQNSVPAKYHQSGRGRNPLVQQNITKVREVEILLKIDLSGKTS